MPAPHIEPSVSHIRWRELISLSISHLAYLYWHIGAHKAYINIPFDNFVLVSLGNYLPVHGGCSMHSDDSCSNILESGDIWLRQRALNETDTATRVNSLIMMRFTSREMIMWGCSVIEAMDDEWGLRTWAVSCGVYITSHSLETFSFDLPQGHRYRSTTLEAVTGTIALVCSFFNRLLQNFTISHVDPDFQGPCRWFTQGTDRSNLISSKIWPLTCKNKW